jgi:hypothetical protein
VADKSRPLQTIIGIATKGDYLTEVNRSRSRIFLEIPARLVRMKGLEPSLRLKNSDLNAARLPIPPHPQ